jgi:predicted ABC-type ATPase
LEARRDRHGHPGYIIAKGLSSFQPESVAFDAGRIMLQRLHHLTAQRADVAFETTLASRTFASWIKTLTPTGYRFCLLFFWRPSADMAVARVRRRVMEGGHHVPEDVIRRRYEAGLKNFFRIYRPLAASWRFYDNAIPGGRRLIASGDLDQATVVDPELWNNVNREKLEKKDIGQIFREGTAIDEAVERAYRRAVRQHRRNGVPMVFWENGKIIEVPSDQLPDLSID